MKTASVILLVCAAFGFKGNYDFVANGGLERVEAEKRLVFNLGMNTVPVALLVAGAVCGVAAYRKQTNTHE